MPATDCTTAATYVAGLRLTEKPIAPQRTPDLWDRLGCDEAVKREDWWCSRERMALLDAFARDKDRRALR